MIRCVMGSFTSLTQFAPRSLALMIRARLTGDLSSLGRKKKFSPSNTRSLGGTSLRGFSFLPFLVAPLSRESPFLFLLSIDAIPVLLVRISVADVGFDMLRRSIVGLLVEPSALLKGDEVSFPKELLVETVARDSLRKPDRLPLTSAVTFTTSLAVLTFLFGSE